MNNLVLKTKKKFTIIEAQQTIGILIKEGTMWHSS